jgi:hypothetical protein
MTRVMRDSTTLRDIPTDCHIVAPYINGYYSSTLAQVRARFPHQGIAWIDVNGSRPDAADILDVEQGDATPAQAAIWAKARHQLHPHAYPPIIYCNRATLTPVFNALNAVGLAVGPGFRLWIATLDGTKRVADMTGVTAVQHAGETQTGGHYDESVVYDDTWLAPPKPPPPPPPPPGPGPYLKHTSGERDLATVAAQRNVSLETMLQRSAANWTADDWQAVCRILGPLKLANFPYYTARP